MCRHTRKNPLSCTICNKVFLKPSYLRNHYRCHHDRESPGINERSLECHLCKYQFLALHGIRRHMNMKHVTGIKISFRCQHCKEVFVKKAILDDHLRSVRINSV